MSVTNLARGLARCTCSIALAASAFGAFTGFEARLSRPAQAQTLLPEFSALSEPGEVFIDLSTLEPDPPGPYVLVPEGSPDEGINFVPSTQSVLDPVTQEGPAAFDAFDLTEAHGQLTAPIQNFPGMSRRSPPDTTGDVGPDHYVQMVNATRFQIWDKQGNVLAGPTNFETLWTAAATQMGDPTFQQNCQTSIGDPIVVYDHLADRWLLSQFANPNHMCIAISQSGNPVANTWYLYQFNTTNFPDYPKFGVWPDGYYMTAHEGSQGVYVFDRANMLTGNPAGFVKFSLPGDTSCPRGSRVLPSDLDGPLPPAGSPNFFVRTQESCQRGMVPGNDRIQIWEFHADWQAGGVPTFTLGNAILEPTLADFVLMQCNRGGPGANQNRKCIRQPGVTQTLDALTGRPMMQLKYRHFLDNHEALVVNETVQVGGGGLTDNAGIRWWELRRTPAGSGNWVIHQQGTFAPNDPGATDATWVSRWMGSMAMDKDGNIALGYSIVNGDAGNPIFPGIAYTGRLASDPLGLLPQGEEMIIAGGAAQVDPAGSPTCQACQRWGDYSHLSLDPVDDCTFWYTTNYIDANGNGQTQVGSFSFPASCSLDVEIAKSDNPDPVIAGTQLTYSITVANNGTLDATDVVVTDTLPVGVSFVSDSLPAPECSEGPVGTLICNLDDLPAGEVTSFDITVAVASDILFVPDGPIEIENTATVEIEQLDSDESNNTVIEVTLVNELADLAVSKLCKPDSGPAPAGSTANCTIQVHNNGPSGARNVSLVDNLVSNGAFTVTDATPDQGSCNIAGDTVTCDLGDIDAGETVTIVVEFSSDDAIDVNDKVTVDSDTPDPDHSNNMDEGSVSFSGLADLAIVKSDTPDPVLIGEQLTYDITVTNNGPSTAINVVVEDILPAGVVIDSVSSSGGTCNAGVPGDPSRPTVCTFDSIASGGVETMQIIVTVPPSVGPTLINDAKVSSDVADLDNSNNLATTQTTVFGADIWIDKTGNFPTGGPSGTILYFLTVHNAPGCSADDPQVCGSGGPSDALDVVVVDALPSTPKKLVVEFVSEQCSYDAALHQVTCMEPVLASGDSVTFEIQVRAKGNLGEIVNVADVTTSTTDPNLGNNHDELLMVVQGGTGDSGGPGGGRGRGGGPN